ncbi:MAG: type VI secretion system tip protein VgrG [Polyangiaceae bacterium]|nr:type VI secretion system tip protein VgrG [Polyangiaceae bacterium]
MTVLDSEARVQRGGAASGERRGPAARALAHLATSRRLAYVIDLWGGTWSLHDVRGDEALSTPSRFDVGLFVEDAERFDPDALAGQTAVLRIEAEGVDLRRIPLVVSEASINATSRGRPEVRLVLERRLALLRFRSDARVLVDRSVPEIVGQVLDEAAIPWQARLRQEYAKRPYTVQYKEPDLAFVSRLLEDEGIYYTFLDDEVGTLILGDSPAAYEPMAGDPVLPFRPGDGLERDEEAVTSLRRRAALGPSSVTLRDWSAERPRLNLDVTAAGPTAAGAPYYDFPGRYALPAEGERKARLRSESFACAAAVHQGEGDCARLAPGHTFTLLDGPATTPDGSYVVRSLHHRFRPDEVFRNRFEAQPEELAFRPPRVTPWPAIKNPLTAFVTGPEGEDIHTDPLGRVKIRFPWAPYSPADDTASCWVPVLQDNTGHSLGIPRVGWEVVVHFVDGDPDRPVVLGRVYNGRDPFPEPLPANKTVSALRSQTSMNGAAAPPGAANLIRIEDRAGAEQVYIQAQKDQNIVVAHDKSETILNSEEVTIGGDETIVIGRDHTLDVGADRGVLVEEDQRAAVAGSRTLGVEGTSVTHVGGDRSVAVGGAHMRRVEGTDTARAASLKEKVGALDLETSLLGNETGAGQAMATLVGGASIELTAADKSEKITGKRMETVGGALYTAVGKEVTLKAGTSRTTAVGGVLTVSASGNAVLAGTTELEAKALLAELKGGTQLVLKVGDHKISLSGSEISIETTADIRIEADAVASLIGPKANLNE